jgi:hypothetical protein
VPAEHPSRAQIEELVEFLKMEGLAIGWTDTNDPAKGNPKVCKKQGWPEKAEIPAGNAAAGEFGERLKRRNPLVPGKKSGLFLVECDGQEHVGRITRFLDARWIETFEVESGGSVDGDRVHFYLRAPGGATKHALTVEDGGTTAFSDRYVVGALATHESGRRYKPTYRPIHTLSREDYDALLEMAGESEREVEKVVAEGGKVKAGGRHAFLLRRVGKFAEAGLSREVAEAEILRLNREHCDPPKTDREALQAMSSYDSWMADTVDEMLATVQVRPRSRPTDETIRLDEVEEKPVKFLKRPFWQRGSFHLLSARKGAGKGTMLSDFAAEATRGELPCGRNVIWVSSEDSAGMDIKPRVAVADGDLGRVYIVRRWVQLPRDIGWLKELAEAIGDVGVLIIDPVGNHLGGADTNSDGAIRDAIGPLNDLADDVDCVVVGIRHLSEKKAESELIAMILGSSAWAQVPRVVLGIVEDPEETDVRHMKVIRGNRVPRGEDQVAFKIVGVDRSEQGHDVDITKTEWLGASDKDLDKMLKGTSTKTKAVLIREAVLDELRDGEWRVGSEVEQAVAKRLGAGVKYVRDLRFKMQKDGLIEPTKERRVDGTVERWLVRLTAEGLGALEPSVVRPERGVPESQSRTESKPSAVHSSFYDTGWEEESSVVDPDVNGTGDGGWD